VTKRIVLLILAIGSWAALLWAILLGDNWRVAILALTANLFIGKEAQKVMGH
jgi:hypothetical protein